MSVKVRPIVGLSPGTRLASYEIIGPLGEGGMGEVYRARDTTLNRDVALKVLPELYYIAPDDKLMAVSLVASGATLEPGMPVALFQTRIPRGIGSGALRRAQYDVAPDGRFLMNVMTEEATASPITVILNWTAGVEKDVAALLKVSKSWVYEHTRARSTPRAERPGVSTRCGALLAVVARGFLINDSTPVRSVCLA